MFLTILIILLVLAYLVTSIAFIAFPIFVIWDNRKEGKDQGDALFIGSIFIFMGILGILFGLAVVFGDIHINADGGDTPKQGCWEVTTTREMVGKTMTDIRHWETIRCP